MIAFAEEMNLAKRAIIEILLIPEAGGKSASEIEQEIQAEISDNPLRIPWSDKIKGVRVVET